MQFHHQQAWTNRTYLLQLELVLSTELVQMQRLQRDLRLGLSVSRWYRMIFQLSAKRR